MTKKIIETDGDNEEESPRKDIEIGSYKQHLESARKGIEQYHIWWNLTHACISMAHQNSYHRIDLRDKEMLKRLEQDMNMKIDYAELDNQIRLKPWLLTPNGVKEAVHVDKTKDANGKKLTKKAIKANEKRDKFQKKIDELEAKYKKMKSKKGPRAEKLKQKIEELELKRDRA